MAGPTVTIRKPSASPTGPGITAPAFLENLTLYDPRWANGPGQNLFRDPPLNFVGSEYIVQALPKRSCIHDFYLKRKQSRARSIGEKIGGDTTYVVAAVCGRCRLHLTLEVDCTSQHGSSPCPNEDRPLHHLILSEWREILNSSPLLRKHPDFKDMVGTFQCSSETCSVTVTVRWGPAILSNADIHTLLDEGLLRKRTEEAFESRQGQTEGMRHPSPFDVLDDLLSYIRKAWRDDPKFKSISVLNKRFIVRFGPEGRACQDVLEFLGFKFEPNEWWKVPEPNLQDVQPLQDPRNMFLDSVEHEIIALMRSRPKAEWASTMEQTTPGPVLQESITAWASSLSAEREFACALFCLEYDKDPSASWAELEKAMRPSSFTALGISQNVDDRTVCKAYGWQAYYDVHNAPLYLAHLRRIGISRNSKMIRTEVLLKESRGNLDRDVSRTAYQNFDLDVNDPRTSDLVRDSRLQTRFVPGFVVHVHREIRANLQRRFVEREEHWRREHRIGGGAYGTVWLEKCVQGHRDVEFRAVKQVSTRPLKNGKQLDYSRELIAIAKFSHDKYVHCFVKSYGWYQREETIFIAMEYLQYGDLHRYLSEAPPLSEEAAKEVTYQILEGLSYMHDNRFSHRDLKLGNILIKSCPPQQWWVKIGDFGISKRPGDETAESTLLKGTLGFIAPELHDLTLPGTPFAADMWSLGEISFRLMTKRPVFKTFGLLARYATHNHGFPYADLSTHNISIPGQKFISSLMVPEPGKRLTAEAAMKHQWMTGYLPSAFQSSPLPRSTSITSTADLINETLASWNSISISSNSQPDSTNTIHPQRNS